MHEKSPCCRAVVRRFGGRRRQCRACGRTWRAWPRKQGRRHYRTSPQLVTSYLRREVPSRYALARLRGMSVSTLRDALIRSRDTFLLRTPWPPLPKAEPLIAIADAMVETFQREGTYTLYLILLRPVATSKAVIAEPVIGSGTETWQGWAMAFARLPNIQKAAIRALVCDGHRGLLAVAQDHHWLIQRCHFHLLAAIQGRRSRWIRSRHRAMGERLYRLVNHILTTRDQTTIMPALTKLESIAWDTRSPVLRKVLSGFITHYRDYRTYLEYPELHLPRTSNAVESLIGDVRHLCYRARGFRTVESLTQWVHALLKLKRTATCNGHKSSTNLPA